LVSGAGDEPRSFGGVSSRLMGGTNFLVQAAEPKRPEHAGLLRAFPKMPADFLERGLL
jgi:hypothetical protein